MAPEQDHDVAERCLHPDHRVVGDATGECLLRSIRQCLDDCVIRPVRGPEGYGAPRHRSIHRQRTLIDEQLPGRRHIEHTRLKT